MLIGVSLVPQVQEVTKEHLRALLFAADRPHPMGQFPVGLASVEVATGAEWPGRVDLWYPVDADCIGLRQRVGRFFEWLVHPSKAIGLRQGLPQPGLHPLILYIPSWFSTRDENTFTLANLASYGFIVAAIDDFVHGVPLSGDDREAQLASLNFDSELRFAASREISRRRVILGAEAAAATIDAIISHAVLGPGIDAARVGVLGFSFGGSIAAASLRETGRVKAAINLDGDIIETKRWPPAVPYLFLTSDLPYPSAADLSANDRAFRFESVTTRDTYDLHRRPDVPQNCVALSVKGATHKDFSDRLVMPSFGDFWTARTIDRMQMWSDVNRLIVSFMIANLGDGTTRPTRPTLLDAPPARFAKLPSP